MQQIKLEDYKALSHHITQTRLHFHVYEDKVLVESWLSFKRVSGEAKEIFLNGKEIKLLELKVNQNNFSDYKVDDEGLFLTLDLDKFELYTKVEIDPYNNLSCEGLYKSGDILCTQNEAQGFRKITYHFDRPDSLSVYTTTITDHTKKFPYLLANGNLKDKSENTATWFDPHPKPCYLFAIVTGDLALVKDTYKTKSGKMVDLEFYVDKGNEDKCDHAMLSLKNSMRWDEEKFDLEYDLDVYMIVAVDSFNMGAMENKGLNIFNSAYVLAKKETATDDDYQGIEAVIGHEYFHNWTGNRVTCRDWFQLTLKEGLTVYRDQEFSSDMLSRDVKRVQDANTIESYQFKEDASGLSHPIKPKSYTEINNFYTSTVYEKGAEVIRMMETIAGKDNFYKAVTHYCKKNDGKAATTEDFVDAISESANINLEQFKLWYDQNGTPKVKVSLEYKDGMTKIFLDQKARLNNNSFDALHIPLSFAFITPSGELIEKELYHLKKQQDVAEFNDIPKGSILSFNRSFSAPILVEYDLTIEQRIHLLKYDNNSYIKSKMAKDLYFTYIDLIKNEAQCDFAILIDALKECLVDESLDYAFRALLLRMPTLNQYLDKQDVIDIKPSQHAHKKLKDTISEKLFDVFVSLYKKLSLSKEFDLSAKSMGQRELKNICLSYISLKDQSFARKQFDQATNMTDEFAALKSIGSNDLKDSRVLSFADKWKNETLVMQKWFGVNATSSASSLEHLKSLEEHPCYDKKVPNLVRSLVGYFMMGNAALLNSSEGYDFAIDKLKEIDSYNPQLSSRLAKAFNHLKRLSPELNAILKEKLETLNNSKISVNLKEILTLILKDE